MKKFVSLRTQRIISFIPYVNGLILFIWLYNYSHSKKKHKVFARSLVVIFITCIPLVALQIVFSKIFSVYPIAINIINLLAVYLIPFALGQALIKYQEKL